MTDIRAGRPRSGQRPGDRPAPRPERGGGAEARPAPVAEPTPVARPAPVARPRPDARPLRIAVGMGAVAAASALVTALVSPPPAGPAPVQAQTTITLPADPAPPVRHVTEYVQLKPGQTAPPHAIVKQAPAPKPRVVVVTTTRQSGAKP